MSFQPTKTNIIILLEMMFERPVLSATWSKHEGSFKDQADKPVPINRAAIGLRRGQTMQTLNFE